MNVEAKIGSPFSAQLILGPSDIPSTYVDYIGNED